MLVSCPTRPPVPWRPSAPSSTRSTSTTRSRSSRPRRTSRAGSPRTTCSAARASVRATAADLRNAVDLREALRAHLLSHHGEALDPAAIETLDAASLRARLTVRFTGPDRTGLEPAAGGVDGALGRLLRIVGAAIDDGTWQRMKVCPAETCRWAFYDTSRNRSAVWCDMRVCGNRAKVRGYRERHAPHDAG